MNWDWDIRATGPINKLGQCGSASISIGELSACVFTDKGLSDFTWQIYCAGVLRAGSGPNIQEGIRMAELNLQQIAQSITPAALRLGAARRKRGRR